MKYNLKTQSGGKWSNVALIDHATANELFVFFTLLTSFVLFSLVVTDVSFLCCYKYLLSFVEHFMLFSEYENFIASFPFRLLWLIQMIVQYSATGFT